MEGFDENEFLDLPDDPEDAFAVLEQRKYAKYESALAVESSAFDEMVEYIECLRAFDDVYELNLLFDTVSGVPDNLRELQTLFHNFRANARRIAVRIKIKSARRHKAAIVPVVLLDAPSRSAIRQLIDSLRAKLNELKLSEDKREALFAKLSAFEEEVDRNRTRTEAIFAFAIEASRTVQQISGDFKPFEKTLGRLFDLLDRAKKLSDALPGWRAPKQITQQKSSDDEADIPF